VLVHSVYKSTPPSEDERTLRRSFFYTDRSIYQPGERVSFKAIILDQASHDTDHRLIQSQPTRIDLMDAQGQLVDSFHGQTNAFGSVSGSFVLPKGSMNG